MKNTLSAEAHVLDRLLYMLEENSVQQLMRKDAAFADYVAELYTRIDAKSVDLRSAG